MSICLILAIQPNEMEEGCSKEWSLPLLSAISESQHTVLGFLQLVAEVFKYPFKILKRIINPHLTVVTIIQYIDNEWSHRGCLSILITVIDWKLIA